MSSQRHAPAALPPEQVLSSFPICAAVYVMMVGPSVGRGAVQKIFHAADNRTMIALFFSR